MHAATSYRVLGSRWSFTGKSASGGMATVYQAVDLQGQHGFFAVKIFPNRSNDHGRSDAFDRELHALRKLDHPAVTRVLDSGIDEATRDRYYVTAWYEKTLYEYLMDTGELEWDEWWRELGRPVLVALDHAHERHVYHRDLTPKNIMIGPDGGPILIDFGIAKVDTGVGDMPTALANNFPFVREKRVAKDVFGTCDTYSWAISSLLALLGVGILRSPGETMSEFLSAARLAQLKTLIPGEVFPSIQNALDEDPHVTVPTAGALLREIDAAEDLLSRSISSERSSLPTYPVQLQRSVIDRLSAELDVSTDRVVDIVAKDLDDHVYVRPTRSQARGKFVLLGLERNYQLDLVGRDRSRLAISDSFRLDPDGLDRDRGRRDPVHARLHIQASATRLRGTEPTEALERLESATRETRGAEQSARAEELNCWRTVLSILRDHETSRQDPLPFHKVLRRQGEIVFLTDRELPDRIIGEYRTFPTISGSRAYGRVVRVINSALHLIPSHDSAVPAGAGELRLDTQMELTAIERQQRGLDSVEFGGAARSDLLSLMISPAHAQIPAPRVGLDLTQELDESKRLALGSALGSKDFFVVHGPPGTGKTTFITELIVQELARDPSCRILLTSQAHSALDNAVSRLRKLDPTYKILRIAKSEKVDPELSDLLLEPTIRDWNELSETSGNAWLLKWARERSIDTVSVEVRMLCAELHEVIRERDRLEAELQAATAGLEALRGTSGEPTVGSTRQISIIEAEQSVGEVASSIEAIHLRGDDLVDRLVNTGALPEGTRFEKLTKSPTAPDLADADRADIEQCEQILQLSASWRSRFGVGADFNAGALLKSQVVAVTCVGIPAIQGFERVEFDLCIVDEASRANTTELAIPLSRSHRFVLVGDDKQLPPYIDAEVLNERTLSARGLDAELAMTPLFSSLSQHLPLENVRELTEQHRMHPAIGRLVSECFYRGRLESPGEPGPQRLESLAPKPVTWLNTANLDRRTELQIGTGFTNITECRVIVELLIKSNALIKRTESKMDVAVLAGYAHQVDLLREQIESHASSLNRLNIECATVDSFQGRESDLVIYSVTRSNNAGRLGFIKDRTRLNVALSRAMNQLVIIGDLKYARSALKNEAFRDVISHIEGHPHECAVKAAELP